MKKTTNTSTQMKNPSHNPKLLGGLFATGLLAACLLSPQAQAGVVVTWSQVGPDVIATYTGTWNLSATSVITPIGISGHYVNSSSFSNVEPSISIYDYLGVSAATPSGATTTMASSPPLSGGDNFFYDGSGNIGLNVSYTSGAPINGYAQFSGTTLAAIFPSGSPVNLTVLEQEKIDGNTIVFNTIPEASSAVMGLSGLSLLFLRRRQRQR